MTLNPFNFFKKRSTKKAADEALEARVLAAKAEEKEAKFYGDFDLADKIEENIADVRSTKEHHRMVDRYRMFSRGVADLVLTVIALQGHGTQPIKGFRLSDAGGATGTYSFIQRVIIALWNSITIDATNTKNVKLIQLTLGEGMATLSCGDARGATTEGIVWSAVHRHRKEDARHLAIALSTLITRAILVRDNEIREEAVSHWVDTLRGQMEGAIGDSPNKGTYKTIIQVFGGEMTVRMVRDEPGSIDHSNGLFMPPELYEVIKEDNLMELRNSTDVVAMWYVRNRELGETGNNYTVFPTPGKKPRKRKPNGQYAPNPMKGDTQSPP